MKRFEEFVYEDSQTKQRKQAEKEGDIESIISKRKTIAMAYHKTREPEEKGPTQ